uniref:C2H2-type domain-containing protein n=1 Tax=Acrobeloides nanus TaxID=290746 RepID=A0A914CBP7_9BILA
MLLGSAKSIKEEPGETVDSASSPVPVSKLKKKAAFEAWHSKKFDEILNSHQTSPEEPENNAPCDVRKKPRVSTTDLSELRKILSAPSAFAQNEACHTNFKEPLVHMNTSSPTNSNNGFENFTIEQTAQLHSFASNSNMDVMTLLLKQLDTKALLTLLHQSLVSAQNHTFLPQIIPNFATNMDFSMHKPDSPILQTSVIPQHQPTSTTSFSSNISPHMIRDTLKPVERRTSPQTADDATSTVIKAKKLTTPRLSRHNDAAYYPNIQCILCKEWVCSRNRQMHIESHLQYRPYKCSSCAYDNRKEIFIELHISKAHPEGATVIYTPNPDLEHRQMHIESHLQYRPYKCSSCAYDNRKEIFIELHISKAHPEGATVIYTPNPDLEHRAWLMAEKCLHHTREVLSKGFPINNPSMARLNKSKEIAKQVQEELNSEKSEGDIEKTNWAPILEKHEANRYAVQYRPRIYNALRIEKSQIIEESRIRGLMPDLTEVANRETKCELCSNFVLSSHNVMEEHVRIHLNQASYRCPFPQCQMCHNSKNFVTRHMKEVHKIKKHPIDLVQMDENLRMDFAEIYQQSASTDSQTMPKAKTPPIIKLGNMNPTTNGQQQTDEPRDLKSLYSTLSSLLFDDTEVKDRTKSLFKEES